MLTRTISIASLTATVLTVLSPVALAQEEELEKFAIDAACPQIIQNRAARVVEFTPPTYESQPIPDNLNTARSWQIVGENAVATGDFHNALQAFDKAIELSSGQEPEILEQRGWVYHIRDNHNRAIADLKAAARLYEERENRLARADTCQMISYVEQEQDRNS
ncbi:hypothetical protein IQ235_01180 [Oscillatoriales cyanobacterium LEGE 11467]|uniref:Tetratricopeptide repeat protein n=1 Tax=Zarconia navalis LEGE 11467 TaxID=1828826 RepID=A0A928VU78_9CYAN|nr:hypothetical protein [Zarconia navalis]MBE9039408.1 hypothetical protein [Zarconia navalis LEGE 11467]